jgi:hypothetical protein
VLPILREDSLFVKLSTVGVLEAILALPYESLKASALSKLAPHLTNGPLQTALEAAFGLRDEGNRARVLAALAPQAYPEQRPHIVQQALADSLAIQDERDQEQMLVVLAPYLTGALLEQALAATQNLTDEHRRAKVLVSFLSITSDLTMLLKSIRQAKLDELSHIQHQSRMSVIMFSAFNQDLLKYQIFSHEILGSMASHLIEICLEWQWL